MPFSSGTFSLVSGNPVVTGTTISSTWANNTLTDIATNGLSICLLKDGTQTPTNDIPMGSNKLTGLGAGAAATDAVQAQQIQKGSLLYVGSVSGVTTITGSLSPAITTYPDGLRVVMKAVGVNGASPTLSLNSVGAEPIRWNLATATSSLWSTNDTLEFVYLSTVSFTGFHLTGFSGFLPFKQMKFSTVGQLLTGDGTDLYIVGAPSADDQILYSTASATAGVAWKTRSTPDIYYLTTATTSTFTTPAGALYLHVRMVGGGGGGAGQGSITSTASAGGSSAFSAMTAGGGSPGAGAIGGDGGAATVSGNGIGWTGAKGGSAGATSVANVYPAGGEGGSSPFGGAGGSGAGNAAGHNAIANTGSGGGGSGGPTGNNGAGGGGAGAYIEAWFTTASASYTYTVGAGGPGGTQASFNGGNGGSGVIIVEVFYKV